MVAPQPWLPQLSLLSLLSLWPWVPTGAGAGKVEVQVLPQVLGLLGQQVHLPCHLQPLEPGVQVTQLTWTRREPGGGVRNVAVFHPERGASFPEPGRWAFKVARTGAELRDGTLSLSGLTMEDEANYTCEFATFPQGSGSARTWLRVQVEPLNKAERKMAPPGPGSLGPVPVAQCVSLSARPPPQISWRSAADLRTNKSQVPGSIPGTVTVTSLLLATPSSQVDGRNVTCEVTHETRKEPELLPLTLSVPYPPEVSILGYHDDWYIGQGEKTLSCDVQSNPQPTGYNWSTTEGFLPDFAKAQNSTLLIHLPDEPINITFICLATNALGTTAAEQNAWVRESPPKSSQHNLPAIIAVIAVAVLVVALVCFYIWKRRKSHQGRSRSSTNANGVSYSAVNPGDSSLQGLPAEGTR